MTDRDIEASESVFGEEPGRDPQLASFLRAHSGATPHDAVDWDVLAARIAARLPAQASSWWDYTTHWERWAIPISLAAGIVGALMLLNTSGSSAAVPEADLLASVVQGAPRDDAVRLVARSITSTAADLTRETSQ